MISLVLYRAAFFVVKHVNICIMNSVTVLLNTYFIFSMVVISMVYCCFIYIPSHFLSFYIFIHHSMAGTYYSIIRKRTTCHAMIISAHVKKKLEDISFMDSLRWNATLTAGKHFHGENLKNLILIGYLASIFMPNLLLVIQSWAVTYGDRIFRTVE